MKVSVLAGLGDYYKTCRTGYSALPFVYQNLKDLATHLGHMGWSVQTPLVDPAANKSNIILTLTEALDGLENETDQLLFYFTGHGDRKLVSTQSGIRNDVYCVTYHPQLRYDFVPSIESFFSEFNYADFIKKFHEKIAKGHLITVMDCCFAGGLVEDIVSQKNFHTVIAASSEVRKAFYKENSFFFKAFKNSWNEPTAADVANKIRQEMRIISGEQSCQITLAQNFIDKPLF